MVWSATYTIYLQPINILQNKALRIISNKQRWTNSTILYSGLKILKFQDLIKLEIAKFMFSYENCQLPPTFVNYFLKISQIHSRSTRFSDKNFFICLGTPLIACKSQLNFEELKYGMKSLFTLKQIAAHSKSLL